MKKPATKIPARRWKLRGHRCHGCGNVQDIRTGLKPLDTTTEYCFRCQRPARQTIL